MVLRTLLFCFAGALAVAVLPCGPASATPAAGAPAPSPDSSFPTPDSWPTVTSQSRADEPLGPGVAYTRWHLQTTAGPLALSVATIDLTNPLVALTVATQHGAVSGSGEPLSAIADRVHAETGINADYYDIGATGSPLNIVAIDGTVQHQADGAVALIIGRDRRVSMGPMSWHATLTTERQPALPISVKNEWSAATPLALLTSMLGSTAAYGASELVLTPSPDPTVYRVVGLRAGMSDLAPLSPGEIAIAAHEPFAAQLVPFAAARTVTVTEGAAPPLSSVAGAVGGGPLLVDNGTPASDPNAPAPEETNVRYPLTGAGVSADGGTLWLVVVDGREPNDSIGLTRPQLASLFIRLGAAQAMAFDSGGSSEMVLRHLGDLVSSVGNAPSDGHERAIADGLFVLNTAPVEAASTIFLRADATFILRGSHIPLHIGAVDDHEQPVPIAVESAAFRSSDPGVLTVDDRGLVTGHNPGVARVLASLGRTAGAVDLAIVPSVSSLAIRGYHDGVPAGGRVSLDAAASDGHEPIAVDETAVRWSTIGSGGKIDAKGTFVAGSVAARVTVIARVGEAAAAIPILVGEHTLVVAQVLRVGAGPREWHFAAKPDNLAGALDSSPAPDGTVQLHLFYDFSGLSGVRAAYAQSDIPLAGKPIAATVDVYGDGQGEWLRAGFRNADGVDDSITAARHVSWTGWRTLRLPLPERVRYPVAWTRFYAVEPDKGKSERGDLWFRNFAARYAGP
ncbi:MAG: phosphodiester glycosidase family protein [Candidatus Eremiobacteraeota bacterium]|nr:phosphodiester glycosidase family protein [Candidatus Eremiobacteraeota bacterium]MBC5826264.1 phosphodiester glycosidase family protein [Candidatus Eremiobacteraeota bacterium]